MLELRHGYEGHETTSMFYLVYGVPGNNVSALANLGMAHKDSTKLLALFFSPLTPSLQANNHNPLPIPQDVTSQHRQGSDC